jgi:hypothetical protein
MSHTELWSKHVKVYENTRKQEHEENISKVKVILFDSNMDTHSWCTLLLDELFETKAMVF